MTADQEAAQNELLEKIKKAVRDEQIELRKAVEAQGLELRKVSGGGNFGSNSSALLDIVKAKAKDFENLLNGNARAVKILIPSTVMKALATTASVNDSTQAFRLNTVGQIATAPMTLRSLFREVPVGENSGGFVRYLDQSLVSRGAAMTLEGNTKGESEIEWTERAMPLEVVSDSLPVTKQLLQDFTLLAGDIEQFLRTNLSLKTEQQLWNGSGTSPQLKGILTGATAYDGYSGEPIDSPNLFDLLTVMRAKMIAATGGKYVPNVAILNPMDLVGLKLTKNADDEYLIPDINGSVAGFTIVESAQVAADTLVVGDSRFATIYTVDGVEITVGLVGNQFKENKVTILAEERLALLVRGADADAFIKTSIAAGLVGLETPNS